MNTTTPLKTASKRLSWLLRHGAVEEGLPLDPQGFASIADVLRLLRMRRDLLDAAVAQNDKKRFEIERDRIRAVQGHSAPVVDADAIEASWTEYLEDAPIFHGTSLTAAEAIATSGIHAGQRSHVHLAASVDATVGKRANVDVLLLVDPVRLRAAGLPVYRAPNGVLLTRSVPVAAIVGVHRVRRLRAVDEERATRLCSIFEPLQAVPTSPQEAR
jgi:putative RNA 2'-phosphotransferase